MKAADPTKRCEALLARLPDGGFSFSVTPPGGCQSSGGYGAAPAAPNYKILFPARSRQGDVPAGKPMTEAMSSEAGGVSCKTSGRGR